MSQKKISRKKTVNSSATEEELLNDYLMPTFQELEELDDCFKDNLLNNRAVLPKSYFYLD